MDKATTPTSQSARSFASIVKEFLRLWFWACGGMDFTFSTEETKISFSGRGFSLDDGILGGRAVLTLQDFGAQYAGDAMNAISGGSASLTIKRDQSP